jgi:hypothetical protein
LAWPLFNSVAREKHITVNTLNDTLDVWFLQQDWAWSESIPAAYAPVRKERIEHPGTECFIAPAFSPSEGLTEAQEIFGKEAVGECHPNPENAGRYISVIT